ncbi:rhodanese-like domain-containing protein [Caulobacter sp. 1776]|uniref:sulfurtransferase n=1 Tax=Caulobacter sp. 1776 TaxID=3156420 RepID=UPI003399E7C8
MRLRALTGVALTALLMTGPAQAAPRENPLVSTGWLASHLKDPDLVLLHIGEAAEFEAGHIPGARFVRLSDIATNAGGRTLEMPTADDLRQRLRALGVTDRSRVVVYFGEDWVSPATRVLFTLRTAGLGERADLLDGGLPKWRREGGAVTAAATPPATPGALAAFQTRPTIVDVDFVRAHAGQPGYALIDARAPVFYGGLQAGGAHDHMKRGHIPGALSVPFTSVTNDDLTFKSPDALLALFRTAGVKAGDRAIVYCHIGQQGTAVVTAARAVGIDAVLYDGSFEDWSIRDLPVAL